MCAREFILFSIIISIVVFFSGLYWKLNDEQKKAVENIILARNKPLPYMLYGPPGTGKTQTLVAAIEHIVKTLDKKILVCANSNAACDEITARLIDVLTEDEMLRYYAKSFDKRKLSSRIEPFSNWYKNKFQSPSLDALLGFRVIVCTLCTASNLARAKEDDIGSYQRRMSIRITNPFLNHFSHVIIDECASTHESMALVAIAGKID